MINEYKQYLESKTVYIPLTDTEYKIANVSVQEGDAVLAGSILGYKYRGQVKLPVISSVSGTVKGFEELQDRFGKTVDHCVISNDAADNQIELKIIEDPSSSEVRKALYNLGIERLDIDGMYTPLKFDLPIKHVVVNASLTNATFTKTDCKFVHDFSEEIASGIELLKKAANAETVTVFADKDMEPFAFNNLGEAIVDKDIDLVIIKKSNIKGNEAKAISKIIEKPVSANLLKDGVLYVSAQTAKVVHDILIKGLVPRSREVVLSGDGIKENIVANVLVGTKLSEIIEELGGYNEVDEMILHYGNFLTGVQLSTDETAITLNVDAINIEEYEELEEEVCTKCGECNDICPVGILPQNIMDAELRNVNDRIVDLDTAACIECGLCSYTCPSKINVLEWVRRAKRRVG